MHTERRLIPIKIEDPSISRKLSHDALNRELKFELDYNNCKTELITINK